MSYLGQAVPQISEKEERIFQTLLETARQFFPKETAKAEAWIQEQAVKYGYVYTRDEIRRKAEATAQSPWTWLIGGGLLGLLFFRR